MYARIYEKYIATEESEYYTTVNLLRWNDVHVENFLSQIATFPQFQVYLNVNMNV